MKPAYKCTVLRLVSHYFERIPRERGLEPQANISQLAVRSPVGVNKEYFLCGMFLSCLLAFACFIAGFRKCLLALASFLADFLKCLLAFACFLADFLKCLLALASFLADFLKCLLAFACLIAGSALFLCLLLTYRGSKHACIGMKMTILTKCFFIL